MPDSSIDSFKTRSTLEVNGKKYDYFRLSALTENGAGNVSRLPYSMKILLENLLRHEDGSEVTKDKIKALVNWDPQAEPSVEIAFTPARVILQDFTGVPAVVDLAAMRDAMVEIGGDPAKINPQVPADLVIDHSVQVDFYGGLDSLSQNVNREFDRNTERYTFLRWGQSSFDNFRVVPPATGIVHQVNVEYLANVTFQRPQNGSFLAYPDTLVGTDSHTTMVNGLGVLGWGVGGIEAEAAMLGQPITLLIPQVVGFRLSGNLPEGATATDLVLRITEMLRAKGVVGKFVEFFGPGLSKLTLADRATLGNMGPEYGATCAIFPVDHQTLEYLRFTARDDQQIRLVEAYTRAQGMFHTPDSPDAEYSDLLELDLRTVEPAIAGPKRPHDRINLNKAGEAFRSALPTLRKSQDSGIEIKSVSTLLNDSRFELKDGAVVIAAITSCTNTSNPSVMIGAGLLAKKAVEKGLQSQPWVKTSLAPGSQVVTEYLKESGLDEYLNLLGFNTVGYGCTTCIGNSGPLPEPISKAIRENGLVACSVLSGNRNFEGRISPDVRANYLASPPLVVAYALAGRMDIDLYSEALGTGHDGNEVFLKDIWPTQEEIISTVSRSVKREMFETKYADVFSGPPEWQALPVPKGELYQWEDNSTYIRKPTFFEGISPEPQPLQDITGMKVLALLGDSVTTDHISPAGSFPADGPAGRYLIENGVSPKDFNSFGSRRGNHEVMVRGTFANIRLRNLLVPGIEGGFTKIPATESPVSIFEASTHYQSQGIPLIVLAGKEYGTGSSRDWAAKGTRLLGIHAVIAESFERIHRSNLIGMGVLPLQFKQGENVSTLGLTGEEVYNIAGLSTGLKPGCFLKVTAESNDGSSKQFEVLARVDTPNEVEYYKNGGILHYVLRSLRNN